MSKSLLALATVVLLSVAAGPSPIKAADKDVPRQVGAASSSRPYYCGCCGCLYVTYDYHRELLSTYGAHFDPRNYDETEPHYHFGRVRGYPQYWNDRTGPELHN